MADVFDFVMDAGAEVTVRSDLRLDIREREPPDCELRPLRFKLISAADWEREWDLLWLDLAVFEAREVCEGVACDDVRREESREVLAREDDFLVPLRLDADMWEPARDNCFLRESMDCWRASLDASYATASCSASSSSTCILSSSVFPSR